MVRGSERIKCVLRTVVGRINDQRLTSNTVLKASPNLSARLHRRAVRTGRVHNWFPRHDPHRDHERAHMTGPAAMQVPGTSRSGQKDCASGVWMTAYGSEHSFLPAGRQDIVSIAKYLWCSTVRQGIPVPWSQCNKTMILWKMVGPPGLDPGTMGSTGA